MDHRLHTVITGHLVEQPSNTLRRRIKLLSVVYFLNSSWLFIQHSARQTPTSEWVHLAVTTVFLVIWLPMCGFHASAKPGSGNLALFNGVQGCLGVWNIVMFVSLVVFVCTLVNICQTCEPVFLAGNSTCMLDVANSSREHTIMVDSGDCEHVPPLESIVSGVFMIAMSLVSFSVAFAGRKTGKAKLVHVITVDAVPTENTTVVATMPQIPEDL
ncbi:hypothetical protein N9A45_01115 [bacterium]|nr:hypothetical protein [bacterium]